MDERELIARSQQGDLDSFNGLVELYQGQVYNLAYRILGSAASAEDVTQEVFLRAYQKLGTLKRRDSFYAWIYPMTCNLCKMHWRKVSRRITPQSLDDSETGTVAETSVNAYHDVQARHEFDEALKEFGSC